MIYEYFSIPTIETIININNDELLNVAMEKLNNENTVIKSNVAGFQSDYVDLTEKVYQPLVIETLNLSNHIFDYYTVNPAYNRRLKNMWFNINPKGGANRAHTHAGSFVSGVYYVKTPDRCGILGFEHPAQNYEYHCNNLAIKDWNVKNAATMKFLPQAGKLILFPSFIKHYVEPNENDDLRISIAFNIGFEESILPN